MTATIARLRTTLAVQMALDSKRRAARLVELREKALLTQKGLEDKSGVSERTIQRAEDPEDDIELRYSTREKLAKALKVSPDDLLPEASDEPSTATNGDTPDPFSKNGGMSTDDIREQLLALDGKLDRILGVQAKLERRLATAQADHNLLDQINRDVEAIRATIAADAQTGGAKKRRPEAS